MLLKKRLIRSSVQRCKNKLWLKITMQIFFRWYWIVTLFVSVKILVLLNFKRHMSFLSSISTQWFSEIATKMNISLTTIVYLTVSLVENRWVFGTYLKLITVLSNNSWLKDPEPHVLFVQVLFWKPWQWFQLFLKISLDMPYSVSKRQAWHHLLKFSSSSHKQFQLSKLWLNMSTRKE